MSTTFNLKNIVRFPSKMELEKMTVEELFFLAKRSKDLRKNLIDFLLSNAYNKSEIYIQDIEMSLYLKNALLRSNLTTLNELTLMRKSEIKRIKNLGKLKFEELMVILKEHNIHLAN